MVKERLFRAGASDRSEHALKWIRVLQVSSVADL